MPEFSNEEPAPTTPELKGLLLLGHGSRSSEANLGLQEVAAQLSRYLRWEPVVETAFLQLTSPTVPEAVARLNKKGIKYVIVIPFFLFGGIHVQQDIPQLLQGLEAQYPGMQFALARPLGPDPLLAELAAQRVEEVCPWIT